MKLDYAMHFPVLCISKTAFRFTVAGEQKVEPLTLNLLFLWFNQHINNINILINERLGVRAYTTHICQIGGPVLSMYAKLLTL